MSLTSAPHESAPMLPLVRLMYVAAGAVGLAAGWAMLASRVPAPTTGPPPPWFIDIAATAGIHFRHHDPATREHRIAETIGTGLAWIDYDSDGWADLFLVQCGTLPSAPTSDGRTHRLFRNSADGTFRDVTAEVGLAVAEPGVGVAVGDFDNDGFDDLLVTRHGGVTLYRNEPGPDGGRRFRDVTAEVGLAGTNPHFATSAAWADLDGDGLLDLYVCNYVEDDAAQPLVCRDPLTGFAYSCEPTAYPAVPHRVYRNLAGRFDDVTASSGVGRSAAPGLGVVAADFDDDGRIDLFVANDLAPQFLWRNRSERGRIILENVADPAGCGRRGTGLAISGMAAEVADVDGSGRPALFVTNYQNQPNVLFTNLGHGHFQDASLQSGLGGPSRSKLGFGAAFLDADRDGWPDVVVANGHVNRHAPEIAGAPYRQPTQLFLGMGNGRFREATGETGPDICRPRVGRGIARCDFDNDGRPDFASSAVGEPAALFRNVIANDRAWVTIELVGDGVTANRDGIGARARVTADGRTHTLWVTGGGSYLSAHDRRLHVGLGPTPTHVATVEVRWPSGDVQAHVLRPGHAYRLRQGRAEPEPIRAK